jgi:hypothetical protein
LPGDPWEPCVQVLLTQPQLGALAKGWGEWFSLVLGQKVTLVVKE